MGFRILFNHAVWLIRSILYSQDLDGNKLFVFDEHKFYKIHQITWLCPVIHVSSARSAMSSKRVHSILFQDGWSHPEAAKQYSSYWMSVGDS